MERNELFICSCSNVEHQMIFSYFDDEPQGNVYCNIHLKPERSILKRILHAVKYILGHRSIYGDFDEFIFKPEDAQKLKNVYQYLSHN